MSQRGVICSDGVVSIYPITYFLLALPFFRSNLGAIRGALTLWDAISLRTGAFVSGATFFLIRCSTTNIFRYETEDMARATRTGRYGDPSVPLMAVGLAREQAVGPRGERPEAAVEVGRDDDEAVRE